MDFVRSFRTPASAAAMPSASSVRPSASELSEAQRNLQRMLKEIERLERRLPDDAKPLGIVARDLLKGSLERCERSEIDPVLLKKELGDVSEIAGAMRQRLLLSPWRRDGDLPN